MKILEKDGNGTVQTTSLFVWSGMTIAEQRSSSNTVIKRFLAEGVQFPTGTSPNTKLFYSKDHLGSIRSLSNENGTMLGTVDYDAYGGISRAPVPANDTSGSGPVLTSAVSRLTHSFAGTFDVNLALSGAPGIEMRRGATTGAYQVVLTFDRNVLSDTSTTLAAGVGSVSATTFSGNTATVSLSGVADRQTITIELDNVVGVVGVNAKVLVSMSLCIGDVNQSGAVTLDDINAVKAQSGNAVTSSTFNYDLNHDGFIDAIDTSLDKSVNGDSLFPDFAFTGHYYHARSGLYLAPYRAYNPTIGRWLSKDPIGEAGGLNLYGYVRNEPISLTDSLGLTDCDLLRKRIAENYRILNVKLEEYANDYGKLPDSDPTGVEDLLKFPGRTRRGHDLLIQRILNAIARDEAEYAEHCNKPNKCSDSIPESGPFPGESLLPSAFFVPTVPLVAPVIPTAAEPIFAPEPVFVF